MNNIRITYFEIIPEDVVVQIFYRLLDINTIIHFLKISYNIFKTINKDTIILFYIKDRYKKWYDILVDEDITIYESELRLKSYIYNMTKWFLFYELLIDSYTHEDSILYRIIKIDFLALI